MTTLKEQAMAYVPQTTKNISELQSFPIGVEAREEEHTDNEGKSFKVNVVVVSGEKYRVPNSVLEGIKGILTKMPDIKFVSVLKQGTGMNTRYQVIPVN